MEYENSNIAKYTINYDTLIPWRKIYLRILMLQKQIYNYTKRHRLTYITRVQNYLTNSNEAKVLAIKSTLDKLLHYYVKPKYNKHYDRQLMYLNVLRSFFDKSLLKRRDSKIIIEAIKQNLLLLFLEPYQKARTTLYTFKQIYKISNFQCSRINHMNIPSIIHQNIFIDAYWNIPKLRVSKKLTTLIRYWMFSGYININIKLLRLEIFNLLNKNYTLYLPNHKSIDTMPIFSVISSIFCLDIVWLLFFLVTEKNFIAVYKHEGRLQQVDLFNTFIKYLNQINIYTQGIKDTILRYEINLINQVNNIHFRHYNEHVNHIHIPVTKTYNQYINNLIYHQRRNNYLTSTVLRNIKTVNYSMNLFVYHCNIGIYYSSI